MVLVCFQPLSHRVILIVFLSFQFLKMHLWMPLYLLQYRNHLEKAIYLLNVPHLPRKRVELYFNINARTRVQEPYPSLARLYLSVCQIQVKTSTI